MMKNVLIAAILLLSMTASSQNKLQDTPFDQESVTHYSFREINLSSIQDIELDSQGRLWVTGDRSLLVRNGETWQDIGQRHKITVQPGTRITQMRNGAMAVAGPRGLWIYSPGSPAHHIPFDFTEVTQISDLERNRLLIASDSGLYEYAPPETIRKISHMDDRVSAVTWSPSKGYAASTNRALHRFDGKTWNLTPSQDLIGQPITALAYGADETLWIGNDTCIHRINPNQTIDRISGLQGLPYNQIRCMTEGWENDLWIGTAKGAIRYGNDAWHYYNGPRWHLGSQIIDIAIDKKTKTAWLATDQGLSKIEFRPWTLARKAAYYENMVRPRHDRHGLVANCLLQQAGDINSFVLRDNDNDGLWTGMYLGALCFQYAATMDPKIRSKAWRHFEAMEKLETITGVPGFFARSFTAKEEPHSKGGEWHDTPDGLWTWKGDTSSDELVGHMFVYPLVYDLLAQTQEEKARVKTLVSRIMNTVVDNGYYLNDIDGKPTRWGVWAPEKLNHGPEWYLERGLNSLQILSFLLGAYHVTQERKFMDAFYELATQHGYASNTINQKIETPSENNHSDDELAFLPYYILFRYLNKYAEDNTIKHKLKLSFDRSWKIEVPEKCTLWNIIYGTVNTEAFGLDDAVWTLREWPLSLIDWPVSNSHRLDIRINPDLDRFDRQQSTAILPPDERPLMRWNGNPYQLEGGGGHREDDPGAWLLPYWMGVYYGFIQK